MSTFSPRQSEDVPEEYHQSVDTIPSLRTVPSIRKSIQNSRSKTRFGKTTKISFESFFEPQVYVIYDETDVTPKRIYSDIHKISTIPFDLECEQTNLDKKNKVARRTSRISLASIHSATKLSEDNEVKTQKRITTKVSLENVKIDKTVACDVGNTVEEDLDNQAPSGLYLPMAFPKGFPKDIQLFLEETETVFLFEISSITVPKGTNEGDLIEKDNERYDYLTLGKGRNRKTVSTEAQTLACILKTRHTNASRTKKTNNYAFASVWDMFDSYGKHQQSDAFLPSMEDDEDLKLDLVEPTEDPDLTSEEIETIAITSSLAFHNAAMMMERILANNNYKVEQEDFKGLIRSDDDVPEENYEYQLMLLWAFDYYKVQNRNLTTMCINTENTDIIATGYGKLEFSDTASGVVCVWSIKNPTQPERLYSFINPLTSMAFSKSNPNLLATGFYNGDILVLDITSYDTQIVAKSNRRSSPTFQPVWHVRWFYAQDFHPDSEQVIAVCQDGRVNCFLQTKTKDFVNNLMMRIIRTATKSKSSYEEDWCESNEIPILRNTVCRFYCPHPTIPDIYFIGTSDGYIYRCSTNYLNQHISLFLAHDGPVYGMQFSLYDKKIFITCGADWTVKIWKENVTTPLVVLTTDMCPVMGAVFSPTHSTIIAAVSGTKVYIWNIQQKIDTPTLVAPLPSELIRLTKVLFTANGKNLLISDATGKVHLFALLGVTKPEENQGIILENALQKILLIRPKLLEKLTKSSKASKY